MLEVGPLAFAQPWLLLALGALPLLWWLLRLTPPSPRRIAFPALRLLTGLRPPEETPARTPPWLNRVGRKTVRVARAIQFFMMAPHDGHDTGHGFEGAADLFAPGRMFLDLETLFRVE